MPTRIRVKDMLCMNSCFLNYVCLYNKIDTQPLNLAEENSLLSSYRANHRNPMKDHRDLIQLYLLGNDKCSRECMNGLTSMFVKREPKQVRKTS